MCKITKNPPEKPKRQLKRFIIIPLQKPLAKFLITDFDFLLDCISIEDIEKFGKVLFEEGRNNFRKIRKSQPRLLAISDLLIPLQIHIVNLLFRYLLNGYRLKKIIARADYSATYYTNRKNLSDNLSYFVDKGYTLVKLIFPVIVKPKNNFISSPEKFKKEVSFINEVGLSKLMEVSLRIIEDETTVNTGIEIIYSLIGLTEKDIKKSTFRKKYFDYKKKHLDAPAIFQKNYDRNLIDYEIFDIKQLHENGKSQSAIARTFNISRGKVKKICDDPTIEQFYTDASRYADNYFDYFLKK
jgi:hypothetical protein